MESNEYYVLPLQSRRTGWMPYMDESICSIVRDKGQIVENLPYIFRLCITHKGNCYWFPEQCLIPFKEAKELDLI